MKLQLIFISIIVLIIFGCNEEPVQPENHRPIIFSLTAFPETVNHSDSVIVICNAMDPDGDTLVYDWITDARLRINGANPPGDTRLFNTFENSRIFYPTQFAIDTVWGPVFCER